MLGFNMYKSEDESIVNINKVWKRRRRGGMGIEFVDIVLMTMYCTVIF